MPSKMPTRCAYVASYARNEIPHEFFHPEALPILGQESSDKGVEWKESLGYKIMPAPFAFRVCAYTTGKEEEEVPKFIPGERLQKDGNMAPPRR